jgi:hypothetical protein
MFQNRPPERRQVIHLPEIHSRLHRILNVTSRNSQLCYLVADQIPANVLSLEYPV